MFHISEQLHHHEDFFMKLLTETPVTCGGLLNALLHDFSELEAQKGREKDLIDLSAQFSGKPEQANLETVIQELQEELQLVPKEGTGDKQIRNE